MYEIQKAAVIGAGTMGLGIAGQLANAGLHVVLLDVAAEGDDRNAIARRAIDRLLDPDQPGLLQDDFADRITIGNIEDDMAMLADVDWIAEAGMECSLVRSRSSPVVRHSVAPSTRRSSSTRWATRSAFDAKRASSATPDSSSARHSR